MGYAKWIGGAVGWALGGPIGGVMGYWLGKMFSDDSLSMESAGTLGGPKDRGGRNQGRSTRAGDFALSMVVLSAAVMQADERVLPRRPRVSERGEHEDGQHQHSSV